MERRTLIAIVLSIMVLLIWQHMFMPKKTGRTDGGTVQQKREETSKARKEVQAAETSKIPEEEIKIQDGDHTLSFTTVGGRIIQWRIKEKIGEVDLIRKESILPERMEIGSIPGLSDKKFTYKLRKGTDNKREVLFSLKTEDNLIISKRFVFNEERGIHLLEIEIENKGQSARDVGFVKYVWQGKIGEEDPGSRKIKNNVVCLNQDGIHKNTSMKSYQDVDWVSLNSQYFLLAFLNENKDFDQGFIEKEKKDNEPVIGLEKESITLYPNEKRVLKIHLFAGPKGYHALKKMGKSLEKSIDFGLFAVLSIFFLNVLTFFYKLTGNYGWSIVIMTCILQVLLSPLSRKSFKSMQSMKKLQPKINELRIKYKDDPKRLNIETMNLYKSAKVNPFAGCLPMVLQLPIFWALFMMLRNSVELRKAEFIFWIKDLSSPDTLFTIGNFPINVLPLMMGISMFLQQKISSTDPSQSKMMVFMPVIFTFIFWNFPSGLVLYWLVNNILSVVQQWIMVKKMA